MKTIEANRTTPVLPADPKVLPCNFRSAGQLANESARILTTLHEALARNLMNSLDVYLGTGLEVRLVRVDQLSMDEFKGRPMLAGYTLPCSVQPSGSSVLLEIENVLVFTIIDLLLGGSGAKAELDRSLTEIDEEIMEGVGALIAQQIENVWEFMGCSLTPAKCMKAALAHKLFPPTEKVVRVQLGVSVAGVEGSLFVNLQVSFAGALVRNSRAEHIGGKGHPGQLPLPALRERLLDCRFGLSGEFTNLKISVKDLAKLRKGDILSLVLPVNAPSFLILEGRTYFEAKPVRQGNNKAMQLVKRVETMDAETRLIEKEHRAD